MIVFDSWKYKLDFEFTGSKSNSTVARCTLCAGNKTFSICFPVMAAQKAPVLYMKAQFKFREQTFILVRKTEAILSKAYTSSY